ncbi:hypothetical protein BDV97DRAFT_39469 [Delphinella strobiligena]|nr:hypothetical protein BDV97DRAFT_39469 [Delphinella strobiligena]
MPGLCTLPPELFGIIGSYLPVWEAKDGCRAAYGAKNEDNFRGINSMSLACKELRSLAEPVLYNTFVKPTNLPWITEEGPENYTLRYFLRTLLERPELVASVRTLVLKEWDWDVRHLDGSYRIGKMKQPKQRLAPLEQAQVQLYMNASTGINLGDSQKMWLRHLYAGHGDAEIALLLTLTSSLEHLAMMVPRSEDEDPWPSKTTFFRAIFSGALVSTEGSKLHHFSRLKRFTSLVPECPEVDDSAYLRIVHALRELFQFPSMVASNGSIDAFIPPASQLSFFGDNMVQNMLRWLARPEASSHIWSDHPLESGEGWEFQLKAATTITTFRELRGLVCLLSPSLVAGRDLGWVLFDHALKHHHSTLETLTLDIRKSNKATRVTDYDEGGHFLLYDTMWTRPSSLRDMRVLCQLQVHEAIILPYPLQEDLHCGYLTDMLPLSVKELGITGFTDRMLPQLKTVLDHIPVAFHAWSRSSWSWKNSSWTRRRRAKSKWKWQA